MIQVFLIIMFHGLYAAILFNTFCIFVCGYILWLCMAMFVFRTKPHGYKNIYFLLWFFLSFRVVERGNYCRLLHLVRRRFIFEIHGTGWNWLRSVLTLLGSGCNMATAYNTTRRREYFEPSVSWRSPVSWFVMDRYSRRLECWFQCCGEWFVIITLLQFTSR